MRDENIVVIGAGPSGIAAAIQLKRYGLNTIVLEGGKIGGLLRSAYYVENYPGFPAGISGSDLADLFEQQLRRAEIEVLFEEVTGLDFEKGKFAIRTKKGLLYAGVVVIASGTQPIEYSTLEIPEASRDMICYDITCLDDERGKCIAIVGAGDAAFDYALRMAQRNQVFILNRGKEVRCIPLLRQRAHDAAGISYLENTEISRIAGTCSGKILIECSCEGRMSTMQAHYLVFAIGKKPRLGFLPDRSEMNLDMLERDGLIHFVGDVKNGHFRQTAIAVGDGIMAAMKIQDRLKTIYGFRKQKT